MQIACVGGGITNLVAAYILSQKGHTVTLFEKEAVLGGLGACFKHKNWHWPLERYYHHFFTSDSELLKLTHKLGLEKKLFFRSPKTSVYVEGKIFRFDNPQSILLFPKLGVLDKIRTGATTVLLKINPFWQPLEKISAFEFLRWSMGEKTLNLIWQPLLESKFGKQAKQIPASWIWTRIKKRSFKLGYFDGGTETLITTLAEKIKKPQNKFFLNTEVTQITKTNHRLTIKTNRDQQAEQFDVVVASLPPQALAAVCPQLTEKEKEALTNLISLGSLCLVLSLKESFLPDGTYWLNITDSAFPFVAVVEHTNYIAKKHYNNEHILYVGGYYPQDHPVMKMTKEQVYKTFLPWLNKINFQYNFELCTLNYELFNAFYSQPIVSTGYSGNLPAIKTSVEGLYWNSLHHVYPEDRGVNYAIALGEKTAYEILGK